MTLLNHIEYLITTHDCVILPGIGAILAHDVPAYFDDATLRWFPPARVISFNPELSRTDGLLASSVSRRDKVSMNAGAAIVRMECEKMRNVLETNRILSLGAVGTLSLNQQGGMFFNPGNVAWLSPGKMWLPTVALKKIAKEEKPFAERIAAEHRRRIRYECLRRVASIAACFAVLFVLGWIVSNNISMAPSIQFASLFPIESQTDNLYEGDGVFCDSVSDAPAEVILFGEPINEEPLSDIYEKPSAKYFLIVASLGSEEDVRNFIERYSDLNLGMLKSDGRFRVYAASGNTWDEVAAAANLPEIQSKFTSYWICSI